MDFIGQLQGYDPLKSLGGISSALGQLLGQTQAQGKLDALTNQALDNAQRGELTQMGAGEEPDVNALYGEANRFRDLADRAASVVGPNHPNVKSLTRKADLAERRAKQADAYQKRKTSEKKVQLQEEEAFRKEKEREKARAYQKKALGRGTGFEAQDGVIETPDATMTEESVVENDPRARYERAAQVYKEADDPEIKSAAADEMESSKKEIRQNNKKTILRNSRVGPEQQQDFEESLESLNDDALDALAAETTKADIAPSAIINEIAEYMGEEIAQDYPYMTKEDQQSVRDRKNNLALAASTRNANRLDEIREQKASMDAKIRGAAEIGAQSTEGSIAGKTLANLFGFPDFRDLSTVMGESAIKSQMMDNRKIFGGQVSTYEVRLIQDMLPDFLTSAEKRQAVSAMLMRNNMIDQAKLDIEKRVLQDNPDAPAGKISRLVDEALQTSPEIKRVLARYAEQVDRIPELRRSYTRYMSSQLSDEEIKQMKKDKLVPAVGEGEDGPYTVYVIPAAEAEKFKEYGYIVGKI